MKMTRERFLKRYAAGERDFSGLDASGLDLSGLDLSGVNLCYADLRGADLSGAQLYNAFLLGANLREANLNHADLSHANLNNTDLTNASLYNANLSGARLQRAAMCGTFLDKADLRGADLFASLWTFGYEIGNAKIDCFMAARIAYFFCAQQCDDGDYLKARNALLAFANLFPEFYHEYSPCDVKPECLAYREPARKETGNGPDTEA